MFPSEDTESEAYPALPDAEDLHTRARTSHAPAPPRHRGGHSVPFAIVDDRGAREAIWKLSTYAETLSTLHTLCTSIDKRLLHAEETLARTEGFVADRSLHELSTRMAVRLTETDDAVRHIERVVASGPPEELFALQTLCATIGTRLAHVEETLRRTEGLVADRTLHELSAHVAARLADTENAVRRIERLVESGALTELSTRVHSGFAQTDDALRRIESVLNGRPGVTPIDSGAVARENPWHVAEATTQQTVPPETQRRVTVVAVAVVLVGVLIFIASMRVPIRVAVPPPSQAEPQLAAPVVEQEPPAPAPPEQPATPARLSTPPPTPEPSTPAPRRRAVVRTPEAAVAAPATPARFVGDLSITSTPAGARVFVNGRDAGVTPLVLRDHRAGSVAVQIASEGFERWSASVQIPAGQVTRVVATLRANRPQ